MDKILSIIVPAYNMEDYLAYCLDSLLIGKELEYLEVLVINDGSTDTTSAIAHNYAQKYPDIFRVVDKNNGNYGSCINRGLREATGKYIKILDADDSFDTAHFRDFVIFLLETNADLIISDFSVTDPFRKVIKTIRYDFPETGHLFSIQDVAHTEEFKAMQMHACCYRREILLQMNYKQTEGISYTDQEWIFIPMVRVKTIGRFAKPVYLYLIGRDGQTISSAIKKKHISHTMQCAYSMSKTYVLYRNEIPIILLEYLHDKLNYMIKEVYVYYFNHYTLTNREELLRFDNTLKEISKEVYLLPTRKTSRFDYITYWRLHPYIHPAIIQMFSRSYFFAIQLRNRLHKQGCMELPT